MPEKPDPAVFRYDPDLCPFTANWNVLGGKWKGLIWLRLSRGLGRFGDLRKSIPQITKKVLVEQLRQLERDGIVRREVYAEVPSRVEYSLTEYGTTLEPVIETIVEWGAKHLEKQDRAQ